MLAGNLPHLYRATHRTTGGVLKLIAVRMPEDIYQANGTIEHGTFHGRWHFSFDRYHDPDYMGFGPLRVFNDDTLSPGAIWPLHFHREIEVVTYCAEGVFRHADQRGEGSILKKGWVQHTTVGSGMYHSEINDLNDKPMRFIQMWFMPEEQGIAPSVEQKRVEKEERADRLLPIVANGVPDALPIRQDVSVYACFLDRGRSVDHSFEKGRGGYFYVLEGGPVTINDKNLPLYGAAKITMEPQIYIDAVEDAELLLVDVGYV
jgi:redox-sensitive bicupin YhaK (pirin superfamily)